MDAILKKLRFAGQSPALAMNVPRELAALGESLRLSGQRVDDVPEGAYRWGIAFVKTLAETEEIAKRADDLMDGDTVFWLAYPKQTSRRYTADVNRDKAWTLFEGTGARLVAQVALDDDWSAVRVRRLAPGHTS